MLDIIQEGKDEYSIIMYIENVFNTTELIDLENWLKMNKHFNNDTGVKRKQIWYQRDGYYFCKNWIKRFPRWESKKYDPILNNYELKIQSLIHNLKELKYPNVYIPKINSCLINKYVDNNEFIKAHQDTPLSFGIYPTIIGLSIGDMRTLRLKRVLYNKDNQYLNKDIDLNHGSIFILAGSTNKYFTHEIEKTSQPKNIRYSLTFREYII